MIFSTSNGGSPITSILDLGSPSNGDTTDAQEIFVRHDGSSSITNCGLYIREYSGTYSGSKTASADLAEFLAWGDATDSDDFGGIQLNFNATPDPYPSSSWPIYSSKSPTGGSVHRTGTGDSEANAILLPATISGATAEGEIQAGSSPNVRFKVRVAVPSSEDTVGLRQIDHVLRFSSTS